MSFVTGLLVVDAPASALNNAGIKEGSRTENKFGVKYIRTKEGIYPYVSAQAFRYWLRSTLEQKASCGLLDWKAAPIFREPKIAYTDADPIKWYDDDLFGYMRAQGKSSQAQAHRQSDESRVSETPITTEITRVSPFRVSTLVSIAPVTITEDYGVMARHEGDPVPYEHEFYRATLKCLFSLNLRECGKFSYRERTGFRNLDKIRIEEAKEAGLEHLENEKCYRLPRDERIKRIAALFEGLAQLEGGAKLTTHYTDVMPPFVIMAVTEGGNHIFNYVIGADDKGKARINIDALKEATKVFRETILSPIYVGWAEGFMDDQRSEALKAFEEIKNGNGVTIEVSHPCEAFKRIAGAIQDEQNNSWLE